MLTGQAGSGKSTIAKYIENKYDYKEYALGDKLKSLTFKLLTMFNIPIQSEADLYHVEKKCKYRTYLQQIGTECIRGTFGDDFWCEQLNDDIKNEDYAIISDLRFLNEYDYFKSRYTNVNVIRVYKNNLPIMEHRSEQEVSNIKNDYIVYNNSSFDNLYIAVDNIMNFISTKA